jgi:hypothetical protein
MGIVEVNIVDEDVPEAENQQPCRPVPFKQYRKKCSVTVITYNYMFCNNVGRKSFKNRVSGRLVNCKKNCFGRNGGSNRKGGQGFGGVTNGQRH